MKKNVYLLVNIIIIILTAWIFYYRFLHEDIYIQSIEFSSIVILIVFAFIIIFIKAVRFYFVIQGDYLIKGADYVKQYSKTIFISTIIPLKLGELFRIYCYGYSMNSYFRAFLFVLIDRFFDTLALITILVIVSFLGPLEHIWLMEILLAFVFATLIIYMVSPKICNYWKKYLICKPANKRTIKWLSGIEIFNSFYRSISSILKGKGMIVYVLSILAWIVEIGGAYLFNIVNKKDINIKLMQDYLIATIGIGNCVNLTWFVVATVILLFVVYLIMHFVCKRREKI